MKVEIELSDIESLKADLKNLYEEKRELEEKLKQLDEKAINERTKDLARVMFGSVMSKVFEDLGFEDRTGIGDCDFGDLSHWLGKSWWASDRLDVTLGANITNQFRRAYISFGIKTKDTDDK